MFVIGLGFNLELFKGLILYTCKENTTILLCCVELCKFVLNCITRTCLTGCICPMASNLSVQVIQWFIVHRRNDHMSVGHFIFSTYNFEYWNYQWNMITYSHTLQELAKVANAWSGVRMASKRSLKMCAFCSHLHSYQDGVLPQSFVTLLVQQKIAILVTAVEDAISDVVHKIEPDLLNKQRLNVFESR